MANEMVVGQSWRTLELGTLSNGHFFGRRKKKLDPRDFVEIIDGFHAVDLCHDKCAGKLIGILACAWELPAETWTARSLKLQQGGVPIQHDLHCVICDSDEPEWMLEPKKA